MRGPGHLREAKGACFQQVALGARAEDIYVETDALSASVGIRRGFGLPKVDSRHLLSTQLTS